jgi:hypothetical protein
MRAVRPREAQQRLEWRILSFEVSDSWDTLREYEKTSLWIILKTYICIRIYSICLCIRIHIHIQLYTYTYIHKHE